MNWVHKTITVPASIVETARELAVSIAGPSAAGMWTTPLTPVDAEDITHYISAGLIDSQFVDTLNTGTYEGKNFSSILSLVIISDNEPFTVLASNNLKLAS